MIEHLIPAWMLIPFAVMLLCIAVLPLIPHVGEWWERNVDKLLVSLILGVPVGIWLCVNGLGHELEHQMVYDYVPFILLLMALFVTTGGICIRGDLKATPLVNTIRGPVVAPVRSNPKRQNLENPNGCEEGRSVTIGYRWKVLRGRY